MKYPLQYYHNDGRHVVFYKYEIDMFGNIYNKNTGRLLEYKKNGNYDLAGVYDSTGKQYSIFVARAVVSTFHGKPPTLAHSTEHIDCTNKNNDIVSELTWMDPSGQVKNTIRSEDMLTACIIVRDDLEMPVKEWVKYLKNEKNHLGREYTKNMIFKYAQKKKYGFSYKVYESFSDETWYKVANSENKMGHWEISDQNRIAYVTRYTRNVIDATRFGFIGKYPKIQINGKHRLLHTVAFESYYPEAYVMMKTSEMILHKFDDRLDFRPDVLYIGDAKKNGTDAHDNGCRDGGQTARMPCFSYIDNVFEKRHESQDAAAKYLKVNGYPRAASSAICNALKSDKILTRYDRTWTLACDY